ncbi:MAG: CoA-binding protein [Acidobacteriota bacterium]
MITDDDGLRRLLEGAKKIAVVGASPKPWRDSGAIAEYLSKHGYTVFPVNPKYDDVLGMKTYPDVKSLPEPVDIIDIFRNPDRIDDVIDEAITSGAKAVWMQLNVVNEAAARKAESAGLQVVMDRCIAVEHRRLMR